VEPDSVVSDLVFALVVADAEPVKVGAQLRYDARDPFAVQISFDAGAGDRIDWTFARDLLDTGLWQFAGDGDVQVWPRGGAIVVTLWSPTGKAMLETPRQQVADFVKKTHLVVPVGAESNFVNFDRELDALLA
jgi:hypothetical protein